MLNKVLLRHVTSRHVTLNLETDQETWSVRFPHDEKLKYPKRKFSPELEKKYVFKSYVAVRRCRYSLGISCFFDDPAKK